MRHKYAWLAVFFSVAAHLLIFWLIANLAKIPKSDSIQASLAMEVRFVKPIETTAAGPKVAIGGKSKASQLSSHNKPQQKMLTESIKQTSLLSSKYMPEAASLPPERSESSPSTTELLGRISEGVLMQNRGKSAVASTDKYWSSNTRLDNHHSQQTSTLRGDRIERIKSPFGTYCVISPNGATAYRSMNGVNISGVSNCP